MPGRVGDAARMGFMAARWVMAVAALVLAIALTVTLLALHVGYLVDLPVLGAAWGLAAVLLRRLRGPQ